MAEPVGRRGPADGVLELELRRPQRRNALDRALTHELAGAIHAAGDAPGVDCVLLTAAGPAFCAGYDLQALDAGDPARLAAEAEELVAPLASPLLDALDACPVPVIAAIQGAALGGGLELALACDLRVAADDALLGFPAGRLGLVYSPAGAARAVRVLGLARAKELFLLGEPLAAEAALAQGVVHRVVARSRLREESRRVARAVARQAPLAQRGNRRLLRLLEEAATPLSAAQRREAQALRSTALASPDFREGVLAFRERRAPAWRR